MKLLKGKACIILVMLSMVGSIGAQVPTTPTLKNDQALYIGGGLGLDYGGLGAKFEYFPTRHFSAFGGIGWNLVSLGWNVGFGYLQHPGKKVSPKLMAMYGYNGVLETEYPGAYSYTSSSHTFSSYETSYGVTLGVGLSIRVGRRGNRLDINLLFPFRSSKFMDKYNELKNNSNVTMEQALLPVAFSIGYNFFN
ncbi:hypothetical protein [Viscerimonas tarda]